MPTQQGIVHRDIKPANVMLVDQAGNTSSSPTSAWRA
jgi:serine/threonine protein kinase